MGAARPTGPPARPLPPPARARAARRAPGSPSTTLPARSPRHRHRRSYPEGGCGREQGHRGQRQGRRSHGHDGQFVRLRDRRVPERQTDRELLRSVNSSSSSNGDAAETSVLRPAPAPVGPNPAPPLTSKTKIGRRPHHRSREPPRSAQRARRRAAVGPRRPGLRDGHPRPDQGRCDRAARRRAAGGRRRIGRGRADPAHGADRHGRHLRQLRRPAHVGRRVLLAVRAATARAGPPDAIGYSGTSASAPFATNVNVCLGRVRAEAKRRYLQGGLVDNGPHRPKITQESRPESAAALRATSPSFSAAVDVRRCPGEKRHLAEAAGHVIPRARIRGLVKIRRCRCTRRASRLLSGSRLKNAVRSATRAACCMLWVTITIV